jgi:hypothetical protein
LTWAGTRQLPYTPSVCPIYSLLDLILVIMHYFHSLLPALALIAAIDARTVEQNQPRSAGMMGEMLAPMGAEGALCPCACGSTNMGGAGGMGMGIGMGSAGNKGMGGASGASPSAGGMGMGAPAAATNASAAATGAAAGAGAGGNAKAIYLQTNQDQNAIIMLPVQQDGTLGAGFVIPTGGSGAVLTDGKTNQPAKSDTLASQAAIKVEGDNLFAVNAGSNTLSMLAINPQDPGILTAVGQPAATGGDVSPNPLPRRRWVLQLTCLNSSPPLWPHQIY